MAETVIVTGATGLIGRHVCRLLLERGHSVRSLSRSRKPHPVPGVKTYTWDVESGQIDTQVMAGATAIIHLAGENLAGGRWTEERRRKIWESRVNSASLLKKVLDAIGAPVHTVLGASATGYYAPSRRPIDENGPAGNDFPAQVCVAWEDAHKALAAGRRLAIFRIGIVLSKEGGAYPKLAAPVKNWVGTWTGSGNQVMSWIHVRDVAGLFVHALENSEAEGVYNAVSMEPVSQRFLIRQLGRYLHRPVWPIGVPAVALRAWFGEMADVVLKGDTITSCRLGYLAYRFRYSHLYEALGELTRKRR